MPARKERLVRTSITLPRSLKERMDRQGENWSEAMREMISQRLDEETRPDMAEAVILNERARRQAPQGWDSLQEIKRWRKRTG